MNSKQQQKQRKKIDHMVQIDVLSVCREQDPRPFCVFFLLTKLVLKSAES